MSIRKDLVIKISNGSATLDMPLQIYEKDHGIELRFKLMDYKYKYDKDPDNILNSNKEDILEAYTTIVNPIGYELAQINGEVIDDTVKFMIEDYYTDELEELGVYQLQIHVKCTHSEFSIPPVQFEVLERLKGEKVVTDGDDEVDYSYIIDGNTKFIDDETGKLIIEWKKGDTISSVRLNAMVEVINNAVDEEAQRQLNEVEREQQELEREQQELERENRLQAALNSVDARVDESMNEYETRFNALTASQQQDMEVIDARDGEVSLKARLDRDLINPLQVYEDVEGSYISCDTNEGYAKNVEILGNTLQDKDNLADIRSVGDEVEGQELYEIPVLCTSKNLIKPSKLLNYNMQSPNTISDIRYATKEFAGVKPNTDYVFSTKSDTETKYLIWLDKNKNFISRADAGSRKFITAQSPQNAKYCQLYVHSNTVLDRENEMITNEWQIEEGTQATPYEPYQEDKLTILSPVQLEKVGDVADGIICKDGVWGVEKNVLSYVIEEYSNFFIDDTLSSVYRLYIDTNNDFGSMNRGMISSIVPYNGSASWFINEEGVYSDDAEKYSFRLFIHINKSKIVTTPEDYIREHLPIKVTYKNLKPTFIPLPHDQQVKLRTFAGQTNIYFETEIEGTIKASIPQSIGSTINTHNEQIGNLSKELDRVKKLEESTVSTVVTESDFTTVEETTNGYFEDVKLEGKTLVNLATLKEKFVISASLDSHFTAWFNPKQNLKAGKVYTLIYTAENVNETANTLRCRQYGIGTTLLWKYNASPSNKGNGTFMFTLEPTEDFINIGFYFDRNYDDTTSTATISNVIILEGDHTQNPPSYFEGLMSAGQDVDEVSVTSIKGDGNLFDGRLDDVSILTSGDNLGKLVEHNSVNSDYTSHIKPIPIQPNTTYEVGIDNSDLQALCMLYDINMNPLYFEYSDNGIKQFTTPNNAKYARVRYEIKYSDIYNYNMYLVKISDASKDYMLHQSDKKPLLYYNNETQTWEKPVLREWDSVEKHSDGKYYYHKRSGEIVLNGSDSFECRLATTQPDDSTLINIYVSKVLIYGKTDGILICDKFVYADSFVGENCYASESGNIHFILPKTTFGDADAFKVWLQANPVTVVYQLAQEEVYECINIDLMTYENETSFIVNAGAISPKSTLKVTCNIANVVRELQQKVSNLEKYIQHVMIDALNNALNE